MSSKKIDGDLHSYEVRIGDHTDLREAVARKIFDGHWALRRLDLRRRNLQDRWNEINNMDVGLLGTQGVSSESLARWTGPVASKA